MPSTTLLLGDCTEKMRDLADNSIDSIVTDPPYALGFMGVAWDTFDGRENGGRSNATFDQVGGNHHPTCAADQARTRKSENAKFQESMTPIFAEALRVAKPGAHLLAFGGTRTYHRLACAIEDAGWEIRDCCMWVHSQGFPKGQNVGKQIESLLKHDKTNSSKEFSPETDAAKAWDGWNTQLKPALEPIVVARKPLDGTVAANVLKYGTGAINIDGCRVPLAADDKLQDGVKHGGNALDTQKMGWGFKSVDRAPGLGRFPANLIHDGSDEVLSLFPDSKGQCGAVNGNEPSELTRGIYGKFSGDRTPCAPRGDSGSAARFFYCAKASRKERGEGNVHPTVKPLALMRYLVRLVTRKGGLVLDPFMGSGTTGVAAIEEGMNFIGIERDTNYYEIAERRISAATPEQPVPSQQELPL